MGRVRDLLTFRLTISCLESPVQMCDRRETQTNDINSKSRRGDQEIKVARTVLSSILLASTKEQQ
jgi:hypothetical protein